MIVVKINTKIVYLNYYFFDKREQTAPRAVNELSLLTIQKQETTFKCNVNYIACLKANISIEQIYQRRFPNTSQVSQIQLCLRECGMEYLCLLSNSAS